MSSLSNITSVSIYCRAEAKTVIKVKMNNGKAKSFGVYLTLMTVLGLAPSDIEVYNNEVYVKFHGSVTNET